VNIDQTWRGGPLPRGSSTLNCENALPVERAAVDAVERDPALDAGTSIGASEWSLVSRSQSRGRNQLVCKRRVASIARCRHDNALPERCRTAQLDARLLARQASPGSMRSTVPIRSIDRSNDAILLIPVLSAVATRYASAKSSRSVS
jgi:hypothetical protein